MKVSPLGDRLLVEPIAEKEVTASGIILPDTAKEKPEQGKVIAAGPGKTLENGTVSPMNVKVGDTVLFKKYSPDEIKVDGKELFILKEEDILGIIE